MIKNFDYKYLKYKNKYAKFKNNQRGGDKKKIIKNIQHEIIEFINSKDNEQYVPLPTSLRRSDHWDFTDNINYDNITEGKIYNIHEYFFVKKGDNVYFIKLDSNFNVCELHLKNIAKLVKKDEDEYENTSLFDDISII